MKYLCLQHVTALLLRVRRYIDARLCLQQRNHTRRRLRHVVSHNVVSRGAIGAASAAVKIAPRRVLRRVHGDAVWPVDGPKPRSSDKEEHRLCPHEGSRLLSFFSGKFRFLSLLSSPRGRVAENNVSATTCLVAVRWNHTLVRIRSRCVRQRVARWRRRRAAVRARMVTTYPSLRRE